MTATMPKTTLPQGFHDALNFPLVQALLGRRSRRFALGNSIPEGALAFTSRHEPVPLSELEELLLLTSMAGNTGWHFMITYNALYAPHLANYAGAAGGRTFPSAAGFHTSNLFFTNDAGTYYFDTRDAPSLAERDGDQVDVEALLEAHRGRIKKLSDGRLYLPREDPAIVEGHNTWSANVPGSTLIIPVADLAQHLLANLCYLLQNGFTIYHDINGERIPGIERFGHLANVEEPFPLSYVEQLGFAEAMVELGTSCYAGALTLQAMGLGGWMYNGLDRFTILGASGDPGVPGLGFRYDTDERWPLPNPTGLEGLFEGYCPPHYPDMRAAVEALAERKFGKGGPFNEATQGPWKDNAAVRGSAQIHSDEFKECVALQAQYIYDRFGKFPGTTPSMYAITYLQAHHLDLEFYDHYFGPGAYLETHARHMERWHPELAIW